jgi:ribosomal protein S6--L-glutamate ligase
MKVAVAGIPGAWSSERMADALRERGCAAFVFHPEEMVHDVGSGDVRIGEDPLRVDGVVVKKLGDQATAWTRLRLHALRALESAGTRVFSAPDVIDVAMDRYRMMVRLAQGGLPIPETVAAESPAAVYDVIRRMGDCVIKPVYTSKGRGMLRVSAMQPDAVMPALAEGSDERYLIQRFVEAPGRDIGATVIGGRFAGAFYRVAREGEWMTTTAAGGVYAPCELSRDGVAIAEAAAGAFALDYTVVDLVEQGSGFLVYEVSAFGGFRGLYEATGVDPSVAYAEHVVRTLARR